MAPVQSEGIDMTAHSVQKGPPVASCGPIPVPLFSDHFVCVGVGVVEYRFLHCRPIHVT